MSGTFSTYFNFVRARQLEGTYPGNLRLGTWPITCNRVYKGIGFLPFEKWPTQHLPDDATRIPNEPDDADLIAKRWRLASYQRVRSETECHYALATGHLVAVSIEITSDWKAPPSGNLALDVNTLPVAGVHSIALRWFDKSRKRFVFRNTWKPTWGDNGWGYLPEGFIDRYLVDGWIMSSAKHSECTLQTGIYKHQWNGPGRTLNGVLHVIELHDGDTDTMAGWVLAVQREGVLDVEDLYVASPYRRRGFGSRLGHDVLSLAKSIGVPIQFWIPWGDHEEGNAAALKGLTKNLGLKVEPSGVRWAPFKCVMDEPQATFPKLTWIPNKSACSLATLEECSLDSFVATFDAKELEWNEAKEARRLGLIEKEYRASLDDAELAELELLQIEFGKYQDSVLPVPPVE